MIDHWKQKLIDFSKKSSLLYFKFFGKSHLELTKFSDELFQELLEGKHIKLEREDIETHLDELTAKPQQNEDNIIFDSPQIEPLKAETNEDEVSTELEEPSFTASEDLLQDIGPLNLFVDPLFKRNKILDRLRSRDRIAKQDLGANILYLAYGFLEWKESDYNEKTNSSPLFLVPLYIDRTSGLAPRFNLLFGEEEEIAFNPALRMFLKQSFGLNLDFIPEKLEEDKLNLANLNAYLDQMQELLAESSYPSWLVNKRKCISVFNFQKLVLFKEMENLGSKILKHPIISKLSQRELIEQKPFLSAQQVDKTVKAEDNFCVLDADSSQVEAIQAAKDGISFVLDGPPGTGKSQTITNIIAELLSQGKKVLFVSEKKAALNVVRDRLQSCGLDDSCLVLHDTKKKDKVGFLKRLHECFEKLNTKNDLQNEIEIAFKKLDDRKNELNNYNELLHTSFGELKIKPYQAYAKAAQLSSLPDLQFALFNVFETDHLSRDKIARLIQKLASRNEIYSLEKGHPWGGLKISGSLSLTQKESLKQAFIQIAAGLELCRNKFNKLFSQLALPISKTIASFELQEEFLSYLITAPASLADWLSSDKWKTLLSKLSENKTVHAEYAFCTKEVLEYSLEGCTHEFLDKMLYQAKQFKEMTDLEFVGTVEFEAYKEELREYFYTCSHEAAELVDIEADLNRYKKFLDLKKQIDLLNEQFLNQYVGLNEESEAQSQDLAEVESNRAWLAKLFNFQFELNDKLQSCLVQPTLLRQLKTSLDEALAAKHDLEKVFEEVAELCTFSNWKERELIKFLGLLNSLKTQTASLDDWIDFCTLEDDFKRVGLGEFFERAIAQKVAPNELQGAYEKRFYALWIDQVELQNPVLRAFKGEDHNDLIKSFKKLDKEQFQVLNRKRVFQKIQESFLQKKHPPAQLKSLRTLAQQKRPRKSIRRIIKDLRKLIAEVHPCWMMSPLSVCQFIELEPNDNPIIFDTVIFDEASQIFPEDAICSIFRAKQLIVAGDPEQMPPTSFGKLSNLALDGSEEDDEETPEFESILNLASVVLKQRRPLRLVWHYRSKYEELIHPSNQKIYNSDLITFPAANQPADKPVKFIYVKDGFFDRGKTKTNPLEAREVAQHLINLLREQKEKRRKRKSVGIIALGAAQAECIEEQLNKLRLENPDLEEYFSENLPSESRIFIKNLETVQGDERDVIILSVGYGKDASGKIYQNFGPINQKEVGHRRLNVAVTRAKEQMVIFCSFHHFDLKVTEEHSRGLNFLRDYLQYAELDQLEVNSDNKMKSGEPLLEELIHNALRVRGYFLRSQVGCSEYKVDLAILRPNTIGSFVLGIECDGQMYNSAKTGRDRDRLRQEVLQNYGWHIHRVWSRDWWQNPERELQKIEKAMEDALRDVSGSLSVVSSKL
jgi:superfamily I DNA and/or RNA helicase/very-short-patch-repair endonuclease